MWRQCINQDEALPKGNMAFSPQWASLGISQKSVQANIQQAGEAKKSEFQG